MKFRLLSLFGLVTVAAVFAGIFLRFDHRRSLINFDDLSEWKCLKPGTKKLWKVNEHGHLQSTASNIDIYCEVELPEVVEIILHVRTNQKFDFSFGLGICKTHQDVNKIPRIENWNNALLFETNYNFEVAYESIIGNELKLQIIWDRQKNLVKILEDGENGTELVSTPFKPVQYRSYKDSGIFIRNKYSDLTVEKLIVREYLPKANKLFRLLPRSNQLD